MDMRHYWEDGAGGGGEDFPIMDYTGRFHPKRVPFSVWRYNIICRDFMS